MWESVQQTDYQEPRHIKAVFLCGKSVCCLSWEGVERNKTLKEVCIQTIKSLLSKLKACSLAGRQLRITEEF